MNFFLSEHVATLVGFVKPANDVQYGIILLLAEMTILLTFIFFAVVLAIAYIYDIYRASENPFPRHFERSVESTLDVIFVVFPTIIILYLLVPSLGFIFNNELELESSFALDIVGHQWYWSYEYNIFTGDELTKPLDYNRIYNKIEFDSILDQESTYNRLLQVDKRVLIPHNTLISATVTSQDVIHAWAVPQLGIKVDAIPGRLMTFILHSNIIGIFYGQCSELCGVNHAFMPICVQSLPWDIFLDWVFFSLGINPSLELINYVFGENWIIDTTLNLDE